MPVPACTAGGPGGGPSRRHQANWAPDSHAPDRAYASARRTGCWVRTRAIPPTPKPPARCSEYFSIVLLFSHCFLAPTLAPPPQPHPTPVALSATAPTCYPALRCTDVLAALHSCFLSLAAPSETALAYHSTSTTTTMACHHLSPHTGLSEKRAIVAPRHSPLSRPIQRPRAYMPHAQEGRLPHLTPTAVPRDLSFQHRRLIPHCSLPPELTAIAATIHTGRAGHTTCRNWAPFRNAGTSIIGG